MPLPALLGLTDRMSESGASDPPIILPVLASSNGMCRKCVRRGRRGCYALRPVCGHGRATGLPFLPGRAIHSFDQHPDRRAHVFFVMQSSASAAMKPRQLTNVVSMPCAPSLIDAVWRRPARAVLGAKYAEMIFGLTASLPTVQIAHSESGDP